MNSRFSKLCRVYSNLLKMANVGEFPWSWFLRSGLWFRERKEFLRRLFMSSTKLAIRHFHVVVVQGRWRNVQKCDAHAKLLFCVINLLLFWRTRCRRRCYRSLMRRCLMQCFKFYIIWKVGQFVIKWLKNWSLDKQTGSRFSNIHRFYYSIIIKKIFDGFKVRTLNVKLCKKHSEQWASWVKTSMVIPSWNYVKWDVHSGQRSKALKLTTTAVNIIRERSKRT